MSIYNFSKGPRRALLLLLLAGLTGLPACAQTKETPRQGPGSITFEEMDTNNDGQVVLDEFQARFPNMSEKAFTVIDKNGDNALARAEWYEFIEGHGMGQKPEKQRDGMQMNNIPGDPMIPPPDSSDLPLVRPPGTE